MAQFIKVATIDEIAPGTGKQVEANGKQIALFNLDGNFYAIDNTCTHRGGPLAEGFVEGEDVTCPWHGAQFNIKTGAVVGPPATQRVTTYNVRVQGNEIEIEL
ncbi:MAG: non-heme iron oxygenase ferredoxin subunit [candidate division KSB1 bacterium]|nr:non-heme iron oxygenase ferredoxin subunit [candidate division KSB1 bacterium]